MGGVATRLFEDIGREATAAVEQEAAPLERRRLGDASVRSSFPTPIDIELRAS